MSEKNVIISQDDLEEIEVPIVYVNVVTGAITKNRKLCTPYSYNYSIVQSPFEENVHTIKVKLYLGSKSFPRRTVGSQFESHIVVLLFVIENKATEEIEEKIWEYVSHLYRLNETKLHQMKYKFNEILNMPNDTIEEIKEKYGTCVILQ